MESAEYQKLLKQYRALTDAQLRAMLHEGPDAYVDGAFALLKEEAHRRSLEVESVQPEQPRTEPQNVPQKPEIFQNVESYLQIAIVNSEQDRQNVESLLTPTGIKFEFVNLHMDSNMSLPVGLMVDESRLKAAINALKDFKPSASILLW